MPEDWQTPEDWQRWRPAAAVSENQGPVAISLTDTIPQVSLKMININMKI